MPWKEKTVEQNREEFVRRVMARETTKSALCREYGISRVTGDKWIRRFQDGQSLSDRSRAPKHHPNRIAVEDELRIVEARRKEPAIGARKTRQMLMDAGWTNPPSVSTFNEVFKRNGLITKAASDAARHHIRFEKEAPNEMWQADFKGDFLLQDGVRCYPLSILDDHSRACLCADAKDSTKLNGTKSSFIDTFRTFGLPKSILCDNGHPWGSSQSTSITAFEVWLMEQGVLTIHIRPRHPQTQGKVERFNGSYKRERLAFHTPYDLADAQKCRKEYMDFYNNIRPHEALGMGKPSQFYTPSKREYQEHIPAWEYESGGELRKVKDSGYLTYKGQGYYLSEGIGGKQVMLYSDEQHDGIVNIVFRQFVVAKLSLIDRTFQSRRIYLLYDDPRNFNR